jgi:hypothetical protein
MIHAEPMTDYSYYFEIFNKEEFEEFINYLFVQIALKG